MKRIQWHPTVADELLIHCNIPQPAVHVWKATWKIPKVVGFHLQKPGGRMEAAWLGDHASNWQTLMLGNAQNYAIAHIDHEGELIPSLASGEIAHLGPEDMFDEENLVGKSHSVVHYDDEVDDTFDFRRHLKAV